MSWAVSNGNGFSLLDSQNLRENEGVVDGKGNSIVNVVIGQKLAQHQRSTVEKHESNSLGDLLTQSKTFEYNSIRAFRLTAQFSCGRMISEISFSMRGEQEDNRGRIPVLRTRGSTTTLSVMPTQLWCRVSPNAKCMKPPS